MKKRILHIFGRVDLKIKVSERDGYRYSVSIAISLTPLTDNVGARQHVLAVHSALHTGRSACYRRKSRRSVIMAAVRAYCASIFAIGCRYRRVNFTLRRGEADGRPQVVIYRESVALRFQ